MCVAIIWCGRRTMHAVLLLPLGCIVIYITTDWVYHHTFNFTWKDVVPPKVLRTENRMMHYVAWMAWSPATKEAGMLIIFTYCRFFHAFRDSEFRWSMRDWWTWAMLSPFPARLRHPPSFQVENSAGTGYCPCRICLKSQTKFQAQVLPLWHGATLKLSQRMIGRWLKRFNCAQAVRRGIFVVACTHPPGLPEGFD